MSHPVLDPVRLSVPGRESSDARPRLLVVDDQRPNIQALYQAFAADHKVSMATSGEQALEMCRHQQPDLVLLDVVMPGMDGFEVCQRLKADEATKDIPVIFVTAHNDEETETRGLDVGATDFISKPINPRVVRARVKTHLTMKRQADLLRQWVYIDGLTGVCNRRYFDERLNVERRVCARTGSVLSVVLVDVDYFKRYNDHYGHQAGDDCLRRVAASMKASLKRPADLVARYGGEEFALLLPDTDLAGAMAIADSVRLQVLGEAIEHAASLVGPCLTVSLGVAATAHDVNASAAALLKEADTQLYAAKSSGRNRAQGAGLKTGVPVGRGLNGSGLSSETGNPA